MRIGTCDENGLIVQVCPCQGELPGNAVDITNYPDVMCGWHYNVQDSTFSAPPSPHHVWDGSEWVFSTDPVLVEQCRAMQLAELSANVDTALSPITERYPATERDTWGIQEAEAIAWTADNNAPTPFIDLLVSDSGCAKSELVTSILGNAQEFKEAGAAVVGQRIAAAALLWAAADVESILAVDITVTAPTIVITDK